MPLQLTDALRNLRTLLGEPRAVRWSDTELLALLDFGQKHAAGLTLGYQRQVTFRDTDAPDAFIAGRRDYALAGTVGAGGLGLADVLAIQQVYLNGDALVDIIPKAVPAWDARVLTAGTPVGWYEFAGVLTLVPYPNAAFLTSYEVLVVYTAFPADWTSGNSVLPEGLLDMPAWFAATMARYTVKKYADALAAYTQYMAYADVYRPVTAQVHPTTRPELRVPPHHRQRGQSA